MKRKLAVLASVVGCVGALAAVADASSSPSVSTGKASAIKHMRALLGGTVNPNGSSTTYYFQWGLTKSYGVNGKPISAGRGTKPVAAATTATGLIPGTRYHYRLVAFNRFGASAGADRSFTTTGHPPAGAATGPPAQISPSSAVVSGVVNPNGQATGWTFQYGTSAFYGSYTTGSVVAASSKPAIVFARITGLASATVFHYRLIARHGSAVVSYGHDAIFMTYPSPRPVPRVRARTRPHHARHKPFVFTTSGTVTGPSSFPSFFDCSGSVGIRFFLAGHLIARQIAPVQLNCTFTAQVAFLHHPGRRHRRARLTVLVHFRGNGYLAPANARGERVTAG